MFTCEAKHCVLQSDLLGDWRDIKIVEESVGDRREDTAILGANRMTEP